MTDVTFRDFGHAFQGKILQALLSDHTWSQQMLEVMRPEYFEVQHLRCLFELYLRHYNSYKSFPSVGLLVTMARDELRTGTDEILCQQVINYLHSIMTNPNVNDLPYVKDRSLNFCKNQALKDALEEAVDLTKEERYDEIVARIKEAITVGTPNTTGHDFFEDFEARFVKEERAVVATGLAHLDDREVMNGGLGKGEIAIIIAPTGCGKCVTGKTFVRVKHESIIIDGRCYNPWDRLLTKRGQVFVRDIREDDELV